VRSIDIPLSTLLISHAQRRQWKSKIPSIAPSISSRDGKGVIVRSVARCGANSMSKDEREVGEHHVGRYSLERRAKLRVKTTKRFHTLVMIEKSVKLATL
jgi:hypothetical protein